MKIKSILNKYLNKLDIHTLEVVKKSSASMIVKMLGMVVGLFVSIFLGRTLGPHGLGIISLANRIVAMLVVLIMLGTPQVILKYTAIAFNRKDWQSVSDTIYTASLINGALSVFFLLFGIILIKPLTEIFFNAPDLKIPLLIALIVMVPQTFSRIYGSALNGFQKIWQSNLVNDTLSIWIVGLTLSILWFTNTEINVISVALCYGLGRIVVTGTVALYWRKTLPIRLNPKLIVQPMLKMAMPLLLVSATSLISSNADTIMLGWLSSTYEVGLYNVAAGIALLVSFFLQVSNASIAPKLASLYAEGEIKQMEKMVQRVTGILIILAFFSLAFFVIFGRNLLSLWGTEFEQAYWILVILGTGQFFNISTGCAGMLLVMCGQEKTQGYISLTFVSLNLVLNYFLIKDFGATGAAVTTAFTIAGGNITKMIVANKKLNILTIPINIK